MMELGAEGVFVGSGIFKSGDPAKRAAAIVQATANWQDADLLARLSENLGEAMVGINEDEIQPSWPPAANDLLIRRLLDCLQFREDYISRSCDRL